MKIDLSTILIFVMAGIMVVIALVQGDGKTIAGFRGGLRALIELTPLLIGVFIIVGFADEILPKERIANLLGGESGFQGILIASGIGVMMPGGPLVSYPLVATLYKSGAGVGPLVAFVTAWSVGAISRLPLEFGIIGVRLTLIRLVSSIAFPPLAGLIATVIVSAFDA